MVRKEGFTVPIWERGKCNILTISQSMAQHALCISMKQEVIIKKGEIVYERENVDFGKMNLFSLLRGLDVINPSMTMTNYLPWLKRFRIYHQLFDVRDSYSSIPVNEKTVLMGSNTARDVLHNRDEEVFGHKMDAPTHAFPLYPSPSQNRFIGGEYDGHKQFKSRFTSQRSNRQQFHRDCRVSNESHSDPGCYLAVTLTSTGEKGTSFQIDFKHALLKADVDTFIAARLLPKEDAMKAREKVTEEFLQANGFESFRKIPTKYISFVVVVQSWMCQSTFSSRKWEFIKTKLMNAKAWFFNSMSVTLPTKGEEDSYEQHSILNDHSKWFLAYLYGSGTYRPIAGVMDLNRSQKATTLQNKNHGRGGMFIFCSDAAFVSFFMKLKPLIEFNNNFSNTNIGMLVDKQLDTNIDKKDLAFVTKLFIKPKVELILGPEDRPTTYQLPYDSNLGEYDIKNAYCGVGDGNIFLTGTPFKSFHPILPPLNTLSPSAPKIVKKPFKNEITVVTHWPKNNRKRRREVKNASGTSTKKRRKGF